MEKLFEAEPYAETIFAVTNFIKHDYRVHQKLGDFENEVKSLHKVFYTFSIFLRKDENLVKRN